MSWDIRPFINGPFPQKLFIREIAVQRKDRMENIILINKALEEPLSFIRQKNFNIIFERPGRILDTCYDVSTLHLLSDRKIYFVPGFNGLDVFFRFNKNLNDGGDSAIRFDYRRMRYPPVRKAE